MSMTDADKAKLEGIFTYHAPKEDQTARYIILRAHGKALATQVMFLCPDSRERSVALTKIQEAVMWANAAIAINE